MSQLNTDGKFGTSIPNTFFFNLSGKKIVTIRPREILEKVQQWVYFKCTKKCDTFFLYPNTDHYSNCHQ